jgi:hypothetical protein
LINNFIVANTAYYRGAGILSLGNGTITLNNNTIWKNRCLSSSSTATAAGIFINPPTSFAGNNNVIYGNVATTNPNIGGNGTADLTYSCVEFGWPGIGNISNDPMFVHTAPTGYCFLSQIAAGQSVNSPCVDAGNPSSTMITGSTRTDYVQDAGIVDMGFHYLHPIYTLNDFDLGLEEAVVDIIPTNPEIRVANYPNPFNNETTIILDTDFEGTAKIMIMDVNGRTIETLYNGYLGAGYHQFNFNCAGWPTGIYFYQATVDGHSIVGKALLVK